MPVIVCVCHRVSDREIEALACVGDSSFADLQARTKLGTQCGSCRECAEEIFSIARGTVSDDGERASSVAA